MRSARFPVLLIICIFTIAACTNSRLVLRPLYNSLDDQLQKRLLDYIEVDDLQDTGIEDLIDHFHVWHRQIQLPHYAGLATIVSENLNSSEPITLAMVESWSRSLNQYGETLGQCNPLYQGYEFLATLSNEQIEELRQNRIVQFESWDSDNIKQNENGSGANLDAAELAADRADSRAQRQAKRLKQVRRYIELAGLKMSNSQYQDLKSTYASQRYPETRFRTVLVEWDARFFALLQNRNNANWPTQFTNFVDNRRQAFKDRRASERAYNIQLWEQYALRTLNTLSDEQRIFVVQWLAKLAKTIKSIANDQPSYTARGALDYQCPGAKLTG